MQGFTGQETFELALRSLVRVMILYFGASREGPPEAPQRDALIPVS